MEHSKELRALLTSLRALASITRDSPNRAILDVNYRHREVYFVNSVVGDFPAAGSTQVSEFKVYEDRINNESTALGYTFTGAQVLEAYKSTVDGMEPSSRRK